ncbi:hypothetical protein Pla52o_15850 [Novipirellula galeiformis]|uniref:Uncharacterized protein n=1 Tax=Novipirellula galeiformis TaxID=2528004 RepID=A0A5C6CNV2_9BACT|nr:hypothetical protein Pla52o_15850 [Novipirellula galeiformis]
MAQLVKPCRGAEEMGRKPEQLVFRLSPLDLWDITVSSIQLRTQKQVRPLQRPKDSRGKTKELLHRCLTAEEPDNEASCREDVWQWAV